MLIQMQFLINRVTKGLVWMNERKNICVLIRIPHILSLRAVKRYSTYDFVLIISPQALRNYIPSHHTGANNFPISLFSSFLSTVLRSFITAPRIARKRGACYNKLALWRLYKNDSLFATIDDLQARDRNSFIRIP